MGWGRGFDAAVVVVVGDVVGDAGDGDVVGRGGRF
jgi:hypothetical protein